MKKTLYLVSLAAVLVVNQSAMAQTQQATTTQATSTAAALPPAGITPDSPFYFLNQFMENVQRFFTFNPEAKARLEIKFAAERISEINAVIENKGVQDKGVKVAEASLQNSLNRAAQIVASEKASGKDVSQLANSIGDQISQNKDLLSQTFENQKDSLDKQIEALKAQLSAARIAGDASKIDALTKQIQDLKNQKDLLDQEKHSQEDAVDSANTEVDNQLSSKDEAQQKLLELAGKKTEIIAQYQGEGVDIPSGTFAAFDDFMAKARTAFDAGNYDNARTLVRQAEQSLGGVENALEILKEAKNNQDEANADQENLQQEATQAQNEQAREAIKKAQEQLMEEQKNALEQQKQAQEQLMEQQKKDQEQMLEQQKKAMEQQQEGSSSQSDN